MVALIPSKFFSALLFNKYSIDSPRTVHEIINCSISTIKPGHQPFTHNIRIRTVVITTDEVKGRPKKMRSK